MTLDDHIILTLWVERLADADRLIDLTAAAPDDAFGALSRLTMGRFVLSGLGRYRLTDLGQARARVLLADRMTSAVYGEAMQGAAACGEVFRG